MHDGFCKKSSDVTFETNEGQGLGIQNRIAVFLFLTKISPTCLISINFFYLTCISLIFFNLLSRSGGQGPAGRPSGFIFFVVREYHFGFQDFLA